MEQWCQDMDLALAQGHLTAYLQANDALHVRLYRASGSALLFNLIDTLWLKAGPLSNALFQDSSALPLLNRAHHDLMLALRQRNSLAARQAIERDLFVAGQFLRATLVAASQGGNRRRRSRIAEPPAK
jgi:DNA-binding GntR family transcriptional regulator